MIAKVLNALKKPKKPQKQRKKITRRGVNIMTMSVTECAKLLDKSPQFVRVGLQRGILPFGVAIKINGSKYTYHISEAKVYEYLGVKKEDLITN